MARGLAADLARRSAALRFDELPDEVVCLVEQCVLDTAGVTIGSCQEPVVQALLSALAGDLGPGESSLFDGTGRRVNTAAAVLVNATTAHAADFDDVLTPMIGHPSAPLVPTVLALGEQLRSSGDEVVTALVAGYEVQCRIGAAIVPAHYARGFHPTGTAATFGVATGAGRLLGLDATGLTAALGIAATQAAGLKAMFGTMTKPLHAGKAAANGLLAARLAAAGVTTAEDGLGAPDGFFAATAQEVDEAVLAEPFGQPWYTLAITPKVHAACGFAHGAIEAMLRARQHVVADDVEHVELRVSPETLATAGIGVPSTPLEAKFSTAWVSAMALHRGSVGAADFGPGVVDDAALLQLAGKIRTVADPSLTTFACTAAVTTREHGVVSVDADAGTRAWVRHPEEQRERLCAKFVSLVHPVMGYAAATMPDAILGSLRTVPDVRPTVRLLAG